MRLNIILLALLIFLLSFANSYSQNWTVCNTGMDDGVYGVDFIASQDSILFASPMCRGIYKSTDNGVNWFLSNSNLGCINNYYIDGNEILVGTSEGLYSSSDYGQNWIPRGFNTGYSDVACIIKSGPNLVLGLTGGDNVIYYSSNNGLNWINSTGYNYAGATNFILVGNTLFFSSWNYGIFASTDNGITWQSRNTGISYGIQEFSYFNGALYAAGYGLYRTYNNGLNWYQCDSVNFNVTDNIKAITIHNGLLFVGTNGFIYKSTNGSNWIKTVIGPGYSDIKDLLSYSSILFAASTFGTESGLHTTTNNGQNWYGSGFESYFANCLVADNNNIFVGTDTRGIYSSTDYGNTWYPANGDMKNKNILSMIKHNAYIFAGTRDSGVYRTSNSGQNWVKANSGLNNYSINSLFSNDTVLYSSTSSGIYKSTNSGQNWYLSGMENIPVNTFGNYNNYYFAGTNNGIFVSSNNGVNWVSYITSDTINYFYYFSNKVLAGTNHGIKMSSNNGTNWLNIGPDNNQKISTITKMIDTLLVSSNNGVYATTNMGNSWRYLGPQYSPYHYTNKMGCLCYFNNSIFAGSVNCVWRKNADMTSGITTISTKIPDCYTLHQNYPNPFNPSTKIKFDITKTTNTKLTIFDITGREVKVLVNETLQPGTYETNWNADNLSSGIYFYKLTTQDFSETKKMLLLK